MTIKMTMKLVTAGLLLQGSLATAETQNYEALAGCDKEAVIWEQVKNTEYDVMPQWTGKEPLKLMSFLLPWKKRQGKQFMGVTMSRVSDEMPEGRLKHIHTYGSTAPIEFVSNGNHPFTGLFQGVKCGMMRVSLASKPDENGTTPGLAIKWFIDGEPSRNFMVMNSLEGQESYNFFEKDFSNWVLPPESGALKLFAKVFELASNDPTKVDVSYLSDVKADGSAVAKSDIVEAEQLYLIPNREKLAFAEGPHEIRDDMATIEAGTTLYTVFARAKGSSDKVEIGKIVLKDSFVASGYADQKLFFRHENIDNHK